MLLDIIKRELTSLHLWNKGAMFRSPDQSQITKFRGKFTTRLDFQSNAATKKKKKSETNNTMRYPENPILYLCFPELP